MRVFTEPQINEIKRLLIELERKSTRHNIAIAEKILAIILQAEPVTIEF